MLTTTTTTTTTTRSIVDPALQEKTRQSVYPLQPIRIMIGGTDQMDKI